MKTNRLLSMLTLLFLLGLGLVACENVKDTDLEAKAMELIATNPDASDVDVMVIDKVATLSGSVEDEMTKNYVESTVQGVKGIKSTVNNIMIIPPAPDYTEMDASLREALPDALKNYPTVIAEVNSGVIYLTGEAKEADVPMVIEKVNALNPEKVENNITVK